MATWTKEKIRLYRRSPLLWIQENFDIKRLHPWQKDFFTSLTTNDLIALKSGNGVGKTATLALTILWLLSTQPGIRIQCTAPTEGQLSQGLWAELALWLDRSYTLKTLITWSATKLVVKGHEATWWAMARTAQTKAGSQAAESLQGVHAENNAVIIDEASGVEEGSTAAVLGMLATGRSKVIMAGNPIRKSGLFYDAFNKLKGLFKTYTIASNDYTQLDKALVNTNFPEMIASLYGVGSPAWNFKVLGEFPDDDSYAMFDPAKLEKMYDKLNIPEVPNGPAWLGIDIADGGDCESIFTARIANVLIEQRVFRSLDSEANADVAEIMIGEYNPVRVNIDGIGVGTGCISILRRRGHKNIVAVKGNAEASEPIYKNVRSELYFKAAKLVRDEAIKTRFPCDRLKGDLMAHYQEPQEDGLFQVVSKAKMRRAKDIEFSPDYSDSFVYSLYGDKTMLSRQKLGTGETARILELNAKIRKPAYTVPSDARYTFSLGNRKSRFDWDI